MLGIHAISAWCFLCHRSVPGFSLHRCLAQRICSKSCCVFPIELVTEDEYTVDVELNFTNVKTEDYLRSLLNHRNFSVVLGPTMNVTNVDITTGKNGASSGLNIIRTWGAVKCAVLSFTTVGSDWFRFLMEVINSIISTPVYFLYHFAIMILLEVKHSYSFFSLMLFSLVLARSPENVETKLSYLGNDWFSNCVSFNSTKLN